MTMSARDRLIVALDAHTVGEAYRLVAALDSEVGMFKIGMELILAYGSGMRWDQLVEPSRVFLDLKLHDTPRTVAAAVDQACELGVRFLTVHAVPEVMHAAAEERGGAPLKLLAVAGLTSGPIPSRNQIDGIALAVGEMEMDGVVCSPWEAPVFKAKLKPDQIVVCPGIRPWNTAQDDHQRIARPVDAIRAGADYIVVGRPIYRSVDPAAAARAIVEEIAGVMA